MNAKRIAIALVTGIVCSAAFAQDSTDFALNDGRIRFRVPATWTAVMEKTGGNPQAIAFQVPDPSAQGSDDTANVTVKTRVLANDAQFPIVVHEEFNHAKEQPGYESAGAETTTSAHRYRVTRGKTRYFVQDSFLLKDGLAVEVRCQRPLLDATPESWSQRFDADCAAVVASLQP